MEYNTEFLWNAFQLLPDGVRVCGHRLATPGKETIAVVSFTVAGRNVSDIGLRLDEDFGVLVRVGLHCAPSAHRTLGTFPAGAIRISPGPLTTPEELSSALSALSKVLSK